jgi:hypothetical protein
MRRNENGKRQQMLATDVRRNHATDHLRAQVANEEARQQQSV